MADSSSLPPSSEAPGRPKEPRQHMDGEAGGSLQIRGRRIHLVFASENESAETCEIRFAADGATGPSSSFSSGKIPA